MREIKFRGKRTDVKNGKFIYGSYLYLNTENVDWDGTRSATKKEVHFIIDEHDYNLPIDPSTLGQFTGFKDMNGQDIYEGDLVLYDRNIHPSIDKQKYEVKWEAGRFVIDDNDPNWFDGEMLEVVGNVYEK